MDAARITTTHHQSPLRLLRIAKHRVGRWFRPPETELRRQRRASPRAPRSTAESAGSGCAPQSHAPRHARSA